jgi:hypothetical protein
MTVFCFPALSSTFARRLWALDREKTRPRVSSERLRAVGGGAGRARGESSLYLSQYNVLRSFIACLLYFVLCLYENNVKLHLFICTGPTTPSFHPVQVHLANLVCDPEASTSLNSTQERMATREPVSSGTAEDPVPYFDPLYEFNAPRYYDFTQLHDDHDADRWFGTSPSHAS